MGAETKKLKVEGSGRYDGDEFSFELPINHMKLKYHLNTDENGSFAFKKDPVIVDVRDSNLVVNGVDLPAEARLELMELFTKRFHNLRDEAERLNTFAKKIFPIDTMLPVCYMLYSAPYSDSIKFGEKFIEVSYSYDKLDWFEPKQKKLLKAIKGDFSKETNKQGQEVLA